MALRVDLRGADAADKAAAGSGGRWYMLFNCEDSAHGFADAKAAADRLAREVAKVGYESLT